MNQESILEKLSSELSTTIETISPSIVLVQGRRFPASGIVWQKNLIITADHSVPNSEQLQIATSAGEVILAAVAGRDPSTDIAILRTEKELQPISASQEKLKAGQLGIAVGRARGGRIIGKLTMVSGTEQEYRNWRGGILDQFIRLDTAAFPGFSGSAFVMPGGKIAGMNTAAFSRHFGLTVPASNIAKRVERLSSKGYFGKPYLGILMQPVELSANFKQLAGTNIGLLILGAEESSPAETAGVITGDILVRFNERNLNSTQDIQEFLTEDAIGNEVKLIVIRGGELKELKIKVGERELKRRNK